MKHLESLQKVGKEEQIKAAQAQKDVELAAVVEKFPDKAAALAKKFQAAK
jgi:predicted dehydrogenase